MMGALVGEGEPQFAHAYIASALFLVPFLVVIMRYFRTFEDPEYSALDILHAIRNFWIHKNIRYVFLTHFLLQLFFAWMVIYTPLYLSEVIGFDWGIIGNILFAGLIAYVILEYPIGRIADEWLGEKEMMALGFCIIALSTSWFAFIGHASIGVWMLAMFATRVGASLVETTTESYFFKHTRGSDANVISFFRITRPLSIVVGALLGSLALLYFPMHQLFIVLGFLMLPGLFFTLKLKDTK
jgi:predicted MFS family arabinose efflux permease